MSDYWKTQTSECKRFQSWIQKAKKFGQNIINIPVAEELTMQTNTSKTYNASSPNDNLKENEAQTVYLNKNSLSFESIPSLMDVSMNSEYESPSESSLLWNEDSSTLFVDQNEAILQESDEKSLKDPLKQTYFKEASPEIYIDRGRVLNVEIMKSRLVDWIQ